MNRYGEVIYLAGLLTILSTKLAIAELVVPKDTVEFFRVANKGIANENFAERICERSLVLVSTNDLENNITTDRILNYTQTIASRKSASNAAKASFWWAAEQFDPFKGKLIRNWVVSSQKKQIGLTVDWQLWTLLDYFDRYRFVNQFGTVARKYGYSLSIFNQQNRCLASYKYNADISPAKWELNLEKHGEDSFKVESPIKFDRVEPKS